MEGSQQTQKIAIVAGASGLTGELLTQKLLDSDTYSKVKVIVRRPLALESEKLESIVVKDLSEISVLGERARAEVFFCCLGTTIKKAGSQEAFKRVDYTAILDFGKLAEQQMAKQFILISALGANATSSIFYNRIKGQTEDAVAKLNIPSITIFRPSLLVGERKEFRFGESLAISMVKIVRNFLPQSVNQKISTPIEDLTNCMIQKSMDGKPGVSIVTDIK